VSVFAFLCCYYTVIQRDSSAETGMRLRAGLSTNRGSIISDKNKSSIVLSVSRSHPVPYSTGNKGPLPLVKADDAWS